MANSSERKATSDGISLERLRRRIIVTIVQVAGVGLFLVAWQWAPQVPRLRARFTFLDPFFISSPTKVSKQVINLLFGTNHVVPIWDPLGHTMISAFIGTAGGIVVGVLLGLVLSNAYFLEQVCWPFIVFFNAIPRVALIPVIILIVKSPSVTDIVASFIVVVLLSFYNAFEGGRSVPREMLQNVRILGAGGWSIMRLIRFPYVLEWTFASLPNAISFGFVGAVTAELFTGSSGVGGLLIHAFDTADATTTESVVFILSVIGACVVLVARAIQSRTLQWAEHS